MLFRSRFLRGQALGFAFNVTTTVVRVTTLADAFPFGVVAIPAPTTDAALFAFTKPVAQVFVEEVGECGNLGHIPI